MSNLTLAGVTMRTAGSAAAGVVDSQTEFTFEQTGDVFSARYRGGPIIDGYLIGKLEPAGSLQFRYVQADKDGRLDSGVSTGLLSRLPDGRLRMIENFQWLTRPGCGQNIFEQS